MQAFFAGRRGWVETRRQVENVMTTFSPNSNPRRRSQGRLRGEREVPDLPQHLSDAYTCYLTPGLIPVEELYSCSEFKLLIRKKKLNHYVCHVLHKELY